MRSVLADGFGHTRVLEVIDERIVRVVHRLDGDVTRPEEDSPTIVPLPDRDVGWTVSEADETLVPETPALRVELATVTGSLVRDQEWLREAQRSTH